MDLAWGTLKVKSIVKSKVKQKRCKCCKEKFTPKRSTLEKYCLNKEECINKAIEDAREVVKKQEIVTGKPYSTQYF